MGGVGDLLAKLLPGYDPPFSASITPTAALALTRVAFRRTHGALLVGRTVGIRTSYKKCGHFHDQPNLGLLLHARSSPNTCDLAARTLVFTRTSSSYNTSGAANHLREKKGAK